MPSPAVAYRNEKSAIAPQELGRRIHPFTKTYNFVGDFINDWHAWYNSCPMTGVRIGVRPMPASRPETFDDPQYDVRDVFGSLRPADALKLYEMAYFSEGNIIELGTAFGLSASIMALAVRDAGSGRQIDTVDLNAGAQKWAKKAIDRLVENGRVSFHTTAGTSFLTDYASQGRRAGFVFVDHAHTHEHVRDAARLMDDVLVPGGFVLFHDYNDFRNSDPDDPSCSDLWCNVPPARFDEYAAFGVYGGAHEGLRGFQFYGTFGCTGLFRKNPA